MGQKEAAMPHYVYRGTNKTEREIYFGVSKDPVERIDGSHCVGATKALKHWDCENDDIAWALMSQHQSQSAASDEAHAWEKTKPPRGYKIIQTKGI